MSTNKSELGEASSRSFIITGADLGNSKKFMDSLVVFLNEAGNYMREVKQKAGISPGCYSLVSMNDEDKDETLNTIIDTLTKSYLESSKKDGQCPDDCEALSQMQGSSSFKQTPKGRAGTPRPGTSPVKGQVASPDQFFIPVAASTMDSTQISQQAYANYPRTLRPTDQVTLSRNVPARRKKYPETTNTTLVPKRYPVSGKNETYQGEGASCDPSCVTLQGSEMGASPAYTSRRYPPTGARGYPEAVTRAPAPRRYLPPRNVGGGGRQVKGRNCDPDCDASASEASVKY